MHTSGEPGGQAQEEEPWQAEATAIAAIPAAVRPTATTEAAASASPAATEAAASANAAAFGQRWLRCNQEQQNQHA